MRAAGLGECGRAAGAGHQVGEYKHLMQRVDMKQLDALFEWRRKARRAPTPALPRGGGSETRGRGTRPTIRIEDFAKIDLRIARIVECKAWKAPPSCCS
jgi:methionyl-tRNA synthetase